jgi:exopolysaccharide biosynthesis polyprenyl glycosylphosphotransferase
MFRRHAAGFRAMLMLADAVLAAVLLVGLSFWRFGPDWAVIWRQFIPDTGAMVAFYSVSWVAVLTVNGLYRPRARLSLRAESRDILRATGVMALVTLSVLFVVKLPDVSRLFLVVLFPVQAAATIASRAALRALMERLRREGRNTRYALVLGAGPRGQEFARKLEAHRELGLRVVGFLDDEDDFVLPPRWPRLGSIEDLERVMHERIVDEVIICLPFSQWKLIDAIAHVCEEEGKIVRIPIDALERVISVGRVEELDGTPVFSLVSGPDRALTLAIKRGFDLVISALALVILSPVLLAITIAITLDGGRPVLFRQKRIGVHGRAFSLLKFRSMVRDAEARRAEVAALNEVRGPIFKVTGDPRITRVGRFLRRTSLDELTQLWNVLRGDMSLVGPRPPLPDEVKDYDLWHRRRLSMKPGITGLWQVRGRRDPDFDRWVADDLEYIDHWSLWLDLQILARTIPAALEGR